MKMMHRRFLIVVGLFISCSLCAEQMNSEQQKELVANLNYLQYSTAKIKMSDNKAVAEDVFYSIINELKIETISDYALNFEYKEFLENCANLKLTQNEKDFIRQLNEKQQRSAYLNAFSNFGSVFVPGQSPQQMVASLIYTTMSNGFAIANAKNQLETQLEKDMFYLDQNILRIIYETQTSLFATSAKLLSGNSSEGRISENSMGVYMKSILLDTAKERVNALSEPQMKQSFSQFAPYWFELGCAYQEMGEYDEASRCYYEFEKVKKTDVVLKDRNYVRLIKNRIQMILERNAVTKGFNIPKDTILNYLEILKSNYLDSEAGEKNSYLAKIYYLIGDVDNSLKCLNYIIDSKSVYPDLIEEAVALKLLINSAKQDKEAKLYQNAFNYGKIIWGNNDIDYSKYPEKKGWLRRFFGGIIDFIVGIFKKVEKKKDNVDEIDSDYLCFMIPKLLVSNNQITIGIDDKIYFPHFLSTDSDNELLCFVEYDYDDIDDGKTITVNCKSNRSHHDVIIDYKIIPVKKKVYKAADKAFKRIGSDISAHNAQMAVKFGVELADFEYEVDDEEDLRDDIRDEKEDWGKENNKPKDFVNSEVTKELAEKLAPDMKALQEILKSVEKMYYKNGESLFAHSLVQYDGDFYLVGISNIYDSEIGKLYRINADGSIKYQASKKEDEKNIDIKNLKNRAYADDVSAMVELGTIYIEGYEGVKDEKEGLRWLFAATLNSQVKSTKFKKERGKACKCIAECYWNGVGVEKDRKQAKIWFAKSKEYGFDIDEEYLE